MDDFATFTTFRQLGGVEVDRQEIARELAALPLDGVLGVLASISLAGTQFVEDFFDARWQGGYLNAAIVDSFPSSLPNAAAMYAPGRVPLTGGQNIFIHEQNLAWLAHEALLHSRRQTDTPEISPSLEQRVCRLLLIANDVLAPLEISGAPRSLARAREAALNLIRCSQFNLYFRPMPLTLIRLARQRVLFAEVLPKYFPIAEAFLAATGGVPLTHYFEILALFAAHIDQGLRDPGSHWFRRDSLIKDVRAAKNEIALIFNRWIRTPEEYEEAWREWAILRPTAMVQPGFDFVRLRETPLIEARPGEVVCPVFPLLLAKAAEEPYFLICDSLGDVERQRFQEALGRAYDEYAHALIERVAKNDQGGPWLAIPHPYHGQHGELSDSLLLRGSTAISFEHKGGRPGTEFIRGGEGARVLGPDAEVVERLDRGERVPTQEGKRKDNGLLTRGLWQQSRAGRHIVAWAKAKHGKEIETVHAVISYLADVRASGHVRSVYLQRLIVSAGLYVGTFWGLVDWLHIEDLESLARLADQGKLDLERLLGKKGTELAMRFDVFLFEELGSLPHPDEHLKSVVVQLLKDGALTFFREHLDAEDDTPSTAS